VNGLLLIAASGLAREALTVERMLGRFDRIGILDDDPGRWGAEVHGVPVLGRVDLVGEYVDHAIVVCVGKGSVRRAIVERLTAAGVSGDRFATVVHPHVHLPVSCLVGAGSILLDGTVLTTDVTIGEHVVAMPHVTLTHDDRIDDYATLCAGVSLGGSVHVGAEAYVGMNASVREGVSVGAASVLGMGSALLRDLPPGETWAGVPARRLPQHAKLHSEVTR